MAYIKLGPLGDYFGSARIGLYLSPGNAQYVEDSILQTLLYNFLLTGFFVEIDKHEFENIKIDRRAIRGIPLQFVGVNQPTIIEPVRDILSTPPTQANLGDRYIVWSKATGEWVNKESYIAEFNGSNWDYTLPENNWIVPIYKLGVSTKYTGTFPSGYWKLTKDILDTLENPETDIEEENTSSDYLLQKISQEAEIRKAQDDYLLELINSIETHGIIPIASQVRVTDNGNYFQATDVEMALQEAGNNILNNTQGLAQLNTLYNSLALTVQQLVNSGGGSGSSFKTDAILFIDTNAISYSHVKNRIPLWALYEFDPTTGNTITTSTVLTGVIAQPYRVTYNDIRFSFPRRHSLILIIS